MTLSERWLTSEQRYAMSYERWLEYVATDAETQLETARKLLDSAQRVLGLYAKTGSASPLPARSVLADIRAMKHGKTAEIHKDPYGEGVTVILPGEEPVRMNGRLFRSMSDTELIQMAERHSKGGKQ